MKRRRGFTLIELLIASSITLVVMLTIYSAFHAGIFGYRNIKEAVNTYQDARQILERLNLDLRNSFAYSAEDTMFTGNKNEVNFLTLVDSFSKDKITQDYAFISYKLSGGKLTRLCRKNKDSRNDNTGIEPEEMGSGVEEINFNYGYSDSVGGAVKFDKELWDDKTKLPLAVKVRLTLRNKAKQDFERTIYLPLAE